MRARSSSSNSSCDEREALRHAAGVGDEDHQHPSAAELDELDVRDVARANDGYCTIATWPVSWVSARTVRTRTSSRSPGPSRNGEIAVRCAGVSGRSSARWSTKTR